MVRPQRKRAYLCWKVYRHSQKMILWSFQMRKTSKKHTLLLSCTRLICLSIFDFKCMFNYTMVCSSSTTSGLGLKFMLKQINHIDLLPLSLLARTCCYASLLVVVIDNIIALQLVWDVIRVRGSLVWKRIFLKKNLVKYCDVIVNLDPFS